MGVLDQGLPVLESRYVERGCIVLAEGMILMHPYTLAMVHGGIPALLDWMVAHAEARIDALVEGRPLPAWPR